MTVFTKDQRECMGPCNFVTGQNGTQIVSELWLNMKSCPYLSFQGSGWKQIYVFVAGHITSA